MAYNVMLSMLCRRENCSFLFPTIHFVFREIFSKENVCVNNGVILTMIFMADNGIYYWNYCVVRFIFKFKRCRVWNLWDLVNWFIDSVEFMKLFWIISVWSLWIRGYLDVQIRGHAKNSKSGERRRVQACITPRSKGYSWK